MVMSCIPCMICSPLYVRTCGKLFKSDKDKVIRIVTTEKPGVIRAIHQVQLSMAIQSVNKLDFYPASSVIPRTREIFSTNHLGFVVIRVFICAGNARREGHRGLGSVRDPPSCTRSSRLRRGTHHELQLLRPQW